MKNLLATLRPHVWAMPPEHLQAFIASASAIVALIHAGVGPVEKMNRAMDGQRVLQAEIAGDTASLTLSGTLMSGVPWWAHAYGMDVTDLAEATAIAGELAANPKIKTVFLNISSPGGQATAAGDMAQAVSALRASGKTVVVNASGMLCSAAYWIAAAAGPITVTPTTITGAIGTYLVLEDSTAADAKAGFTYTLVSSGGVKGHGADGKVTDKLKSEMQTMVDTFTTLFVEGVAKGRGLPVEQVRALATGQVWLGTEAKSLGLVDSVTGSASAPATIAPTPTPSVQNQTPLPAPVATHPANQNAAAKAGDPMKVTALILAALCREFPQQKDLVLTRAEAGDDEVAIRAAALKQDRDDSTKAVATANAAVATEQAEHAKTKAELVRVQTERDQLKALSKAGGKPDPEEGTPPNANAKTMTREEYNKLDLAARSDFHKNKGVIEG